MNLLGSSEKNILSPETLKNMHKIHWDDESISVTRGLGFGVYNLDGESWVGHGDHVQDTGLSFTLVQI